LFLGINSRITRRGAPQKSDLIKIAGDRRRGEEEKKMKILPLLSFFSLLQSSFSTLCFPHGPTCNEGRRAGRLLTLEYYCTTVWNMKRDYAPGITPDHPCSLPGEEHV